MGRAATTIVDEAQDFRADVVVVGSRGHGAIASLVLGSVSSEIVDHAPCPVLVVRQSGVSRVLLATDGSPSAAAALALLAQAHVLANLPVHVVSVAEVAGPWHSGIAPTMYRLAMDEHMRDLEDATAKHGLIAEAAATQLRAAGHEATVEVPVGDAAAEVIAAGDRWGADLIVIGSRGQTGLKRFLLGSVARNVSHGTKSSVLVVRDHIAY